MSSLKFREGNRVDLDLHFGCSLWLHQDEVQIPAMQEFMNFIIDLYDDDHEKWEKYRSFYISMNASIGLDFSEEAKSFKITAGEWVNEMARNFNFKNFTSVDDLIKFPKMSQKTPLVWGRVIDFQPTIHELKMFNGNQEQVDEAQALNQAIMDARTSEFWNNPFL